MHDLIVIGSRGSQLALWQARWIQQRLEALGARTRIEIIRTTGDKITDAPLALVGSKGLFTKEIEEALLAGAIDCAVHSLKDLPTVVPPGLVIVAIPERQDPRDALIGARLADLKHGAKVGTGSLRRAAQLRALRPDLVIEPLRGNLDTRLRKLDEGRYDAIVLAAAGLRRLGWESRIAELLPPEQVCPAVGQGALAVETRDDSGYAHSLCAQLDHAPTRRAVSAERALLARLGGGCQAPIGAHARVDPDGTLALAAVLIHPDSSPAVRVTESGVEPVELGARTARRLLAQGGRAILRAVYGPALPLAGQTIVVTRAREQAPALSDRLRALGAEVLELPVIEFQPLEFTVPDLAAYDWMIFTSVNGVEFFFRRAPAPPSARLCAIGPATAAALRARGFEVDVVPAEFVAESVVATLAQGGVSGKRFLLPRAETARDVIPEELRRLGAHLDVLPVYRTGVPASLAQQARRVFALQPDWITLTSSSTVKNLLAAVGAEALRDIRIASIGPVTSGVARSHGLTVAVEASPYTLAGLVSAMLPA